MAPKGLILALLATSSERSASGGAEKSVFAVLSEAARRVRMASPASVVTGGLLALAAAALLVCAAMSGVRGESRTEGEPTGWVRGRCLSACMFVNISQTETLSLSLPLSLSAEALALNMELEFAAIQAVLRHLDDNHDGSVDLSESEEVGGCLATLLRVCVWRKKRFISFSSKCVV